MSHNAKTNNIRKIAFFNNRAQIKNALDVVERVTAGDFEARITGISAEGDLGDLLYAINDLIDRADAYVRESQACLEHVSNNEYYRKIIETSMEGAFLNASETVNAALGAMQNKVTSFNKVTDEFEITVGDVAATLSSAAEQLNSAAVSMENVSSDTNIKATTVAAAAEEASTNVQTVASASEQLSASIGEISQQISQAAKIASNSSITVKDVEQKVIDLQEAGSQIGRAVELINDIANQTNLLALNATIEAARAGEVGKGFAVVASEVKSLANETAKATDEIDGYVSAIQAAVEDAVNGIQQVSRQISDIDSANTTVSAAVEEQSSATKEIARNIDEASRGAADVTKNITQVTQGAEKTGQTAVEVNSAAQELSQQAMHLKEVVSTYLKGARQVI